MTHEFSLSQVKITPRHLERKAVIYIRRSSSPKQVREHLDSQLTQRTLVRRAAHLGWHPERIEVFDGDLGQSARGVRSAMTLKRWPPRSPWATSVLCSGGRSRVGAQQRRVVSALDLAALLGTLIGDTDGIYDPRLYNDRLLLGLKGTMSEAEHYLMQQRLNAGRLSKVQQRGEYVQRLPTDWYDSRIKASSKIQTNRFNMSLDWS